jgi:twitching motility protein PilT
MANDEVDGEQVQQPMIVAGGSFESSRWAHIKPQDIIDWYLPIKNPLSGRAAYGDLFIDLRLMPQCEEFVGALVDDIEEKGFDKRIEKDFNLRLDVTIEGHKKRIKFRGHRQQSIDGEFLILRQMPLVLPDLVTLGLPEAIQYILMHQELNRGGLVLICGEPGNGKSTTTAAMIKARLQTYGGFCLTLENPVEMPLHGQHGNGFCIQTPVEEGNFEDALSAAMRCYPTAAKSILYLGEVRSAETAAEALRIANNGHLVITTLHSSSVLTCLKRLLSLSKTKSMSDEEAASLLSTSLRLVLHQKLEQGPNDTKQLKVGFLFSESNHSPAANRIRSGNVDNLITEIEQQNQMLKTGQIGRLLELWKNQKDPWG